MNMQLEYLEVDSFQEQKDAEHKGYRHVTTKGDGRYMVIVMARTKRKKRQQKPYQMARKAENVFWGCYFVLVGGSLSYLVFWCFTNL